MPTDIRAPHEAFSFPEPMTFGAAIRSCIAKWGTFSGRASRSEFWFWKLACFLVGTVAVLLDVLFFGVGVDGETSFGPVYILFFVASFVPDLAVTWRRLHDADYSGLWFFILLVPFLGFVVLLVLALLPGTVGGNRFGARPQA